MKIIIGSNWRRAIKGVMLRYMPGMLNCREFEYALQAQLDGARNPFQRWKFELHLRLCRECRDYLAAYERTVELTKALHANSGSPLPEQTQEKMVKAILESRSR